MTLRCPAVLLKVFRSVQWMEMKSPCMSFSLLAAQLSMMASSVSDDSPKTSQQSFRLEILNLPANFFTSRCVSAIYLIFFLVASAKTRGISVLTGISKVTVSFQGNTISQREQMRSWRFLVYIAQTSTLNFIYNPSTFSRPVAQYRLSLGDSPLKGTSPDYLLNPICAKLFSRKVSTLRQNFSMMDKLALLPRTQMIRQRKIIEIPRAQYLYLLKVARSNLKGYLWMGT